MILKKTLKLFLFILILLSSNYLISQYSKSHYIPPLTTTGNGSANPLEQYLYISTPSETPVNVVIKPVGGVEIAGTASNSNPWAYYIGSGTNTNLIITTNQLNGNTFDNKGYVIEAEDLVYASARLFTGSNYQAGSIVSKGTAALGTEFRAGSFENAGNLTGGTPSNYLNFITVLATQDNTEVNFSEFGNGVTILNNVPTENIILNNGESYSVAISPYPTSTNSANATGLIGALVESDKPIAVNAGSFTGSNSNYNEGGGQDVGIDQVAPANIIGDEYIFVRGLGPDEVERPLIVAHEDNTEIFVNGNLQTVINAGEYYSIPSTFYGASYSNTVYDGNGNVNDDGYPDVLYAVNREDGRSGQPAETNAAFASVLLSQENGTYSHIHVGVENWYHSAGIVNGDSGPEIWLGGYFQSSGHIYRDDKTQVASGFGYSFDNVSNTFSAVIQVPAHANTFTPIPNTESSSVTEKVVSVVDAFSNGVQTGSGLGLFSKNDDPSWTMVSSYLPQSTVTVNYVSYTRNEGLSTLTEIDGSPILAYGHSASSTMELFPDSIPVAVFKANGSIIRSPRDDGAYYEDDGQAFSRLEFYSTENQTLTPLPVRVLDEDTQQNINFFDCIDLTNDGLIEAYKEIRGIQIL